MNQLTKTIYDGLRERDVFKGDYSAFEATLQDDNVRKKLYRQLAISGVLHNRSYDEFTADLGVSPKPDIPYPERVPEGPIYRTPPYDPVEAARMKLRNEHAAKKRRSDALLDKMRQNPQDYPGGSQGMPKVLPMFGSSWDKITVQGEDLTKKEKEALQKHYKAEEQRLRKMAEEEDERLKDIHRKNLETYDELPWYAKIGGPSYAINTHAADRMNAADPEYRMTEDIIRNLDTSADTYAAPTTFGDEWWITNFGRGIGNVVSDADFLTRGLTEARRQLTELGVKDKMNRILEDAEREGWDEETTSQKMYDALTDTERRLYASTMELMAAQAVRSADTSLGYQAGQALAESAGYMLDFYLSGKLLNASPAFRNMTARALRSLHGRIAKDGGKALSALSRAEKAAYGAGKFGIRAADASAQTALRTAMFPSTYNEVLDNRLEVDEKGRYVNSWASSLANGYTDSFLENLSEMSGPMMTRLLKFGGQGAKATAKFIASPVLKSKPVRKATEAYARKIRETGLSAAAREKKVLADALAKAGYYGPVEEYMEEVFNAVMMTAKGYITGNEEDKRQFGQFWTFDNNAVLVPTVMLPGAVTSTYNLIANRGAIKTQRQKEKTYSLYPWLRNSDEVNRWNAHELRRKVNASTVPDGQDKSQGRIQQVQLTDGRTVYVTQGQLAFNMDNTVDGDNSADGVTVMDAKGRKSVVSTKGNGIRVEKLLSDMPYETEKRYEERQNEREARARYNYSVGKEVRFSDPITGELKTNPDGSPSTGTIIGIGDGVVRIDTHDPTLSDPVMVVSYTDLDAGKWLVPNRDGAEIKMPEGGAYSFTVDHGDGRRETVTVEGVNSDGTSIASLRDKDGNFKGRETMTRARLEWLEERKVQDTQEREQEQEQQQPVTTEERQPQAREQDADQQYATRQETSKSGVVAGDHNMGDTFAFTDEDGDNYVVEITAANPDGTFDVSFTQTNGTHRMTRQSVTADALDAMKLLTAGNSPSPIGAQAKEADTRQENLKPIGRPLSEEEADALLTEMEAGAETATEMELTPENWVSQFGEDGMVDTPLGKVKMGDNQYLKLAQKGRSGKLGMVKPTLENPDVIVEDNSFAKDDQKTERASSYVFIKAFKKADGSRYYLFTSVTVSKDGKEVVISNQEKSSNKISKLLQNGKIAWIKESSLHPMTQDGKPVSLNDSNKSTTSGNQPAMLGINSSANSTSKDTQSSQTTQDPVQEIADGTVSLMGSVQAAQKAMAHTVAESQKKLAEVDRKIEAAEVVLTDPKSVKRYKDLQAQAQQLRQTIDSYTAAMERLAQPQAQPTGDTGTQEDATPEDVRSVPLYTEEDPKQGRTRGWRKTVSDIVRRPERVAAAKGGTTRVKFSTDTEQEGVHAVIEADELQPSHRQGVKNPYHFLDEAQPKDREGKDSVAASRKIAAGINPQEITGGVTAYTGSPSVNARGEVIQGNNRADALIYMYANEPEAAARYKQYLVEHADEFGLDAEKVASMSKPVLVNMLDVPDDRAIELGQLTSSDLESGGTQPISPSNVANQLASKGLADRYAGMLLRGEEDESISELVVRNGREALVFLRNVAGVINDTQYRGALREDGELTPEARVALADILTMQLLGGNKALRTMFGKLPAKAQKAIMATAYRDSQSNEADRMQDEIRASIIAFNSLMEDADFAKATNYEDARRAMEAAKRQMSWDFAANTQAALMQRFSNFALTLAAMYKGSTQRQIQATFNDIYNYVQGTGQMGLFDAEAPRPHSLEEAIRHVLGLDYQPINKQYYGNTRSDNVGGNSPQGEARGQGSPRDVAIGEQGEAGERPADGGRGTAEDGRTVSPTPTFLDAVRTIYSKGKEAASKLFSMNFFDVAKTPDFMRELGLRGDRFTIRYGVIARHAGKDGSHTLTEKDWEQLPEALQTPFAITRIKDKDNAYRIYTTLQTGTGEYVVVGADVKNAGKDIEVNAIATVFGRRNNAGITTNEEVVYESKKITPEQSALLKRPNFAQYPTEEELSTDKDTKNPETIQQITDAVEKLGLGVEIITSPSQLPKEEKKAREAIEKGAEVKGWYNAKTGKAYLYLPNAEDAADAVETVLHEVVAHKGLRGLLGKEGFDRLCDEVWDMMDAGQRRRFMAYVTRKRKMTETEFLAAVADGNKRREAADEYIAHLAESLDTEKLANESAWKKVLEAVRAFLGRMGIGRDANISDESITRLLQDSYRQLRRQKEGGNTENIIKENISKAESEVNVTPTEAQKKAGNYKKGHVRIDGYDITIEQPKGSTRSGTDENGKTWETKMNNTYGYIRGTQSVDGDHIDVFLSDNPTKGNVYVVDQIDQKTGEFDEHKVMYGFNSMEEAKNAYLSNYSKGWKIGNITEVNKEEFKKWVESSHRKTKPFSEYSSVNKQKQEEKGNSALFRIGNEVATAEERRIEEEAKANGTFMKAPNGKPTNLTQKQWLQVRTKAFKQWFGDWEKAARIEKLRNSKPVTVSGNDYQGKYELNGKSAAEYIISNLRGGYANIDTGNVINISRKGAFKVTHHDVENQAHLKSVAYIPQLIENAIFIAEEPNTKNKNGFDSYRYYVVGLNMDGTDYTAKLVIGIKNGEAYYDHSLTQIEKSNLIESIDDIKRSFADNEAAQYSTVKDKRLISLLQTDSSKIVDENGEPMVVYHGTPLSRKQITPNRGWQRDGVTYISQEAPFTEFVGGGYSGLIFTSVEYNKAQSIAEKRAMNIPDDEYGNEQWTDEGYVYVLFLNIRNPFDPKDNTSVKSILDTFSGEIPTLSFYGGNGENVSKEEAMNIASSENNSWLVTETPEFLDRIKKSGYDGLVGYDEWVKYIAVTSPTQIKSATDNTGEFSTENDDIRFRIRTSNPPKKTGIGYKVFVLKNDKLYPPMVANPNGTDTPVGVWLDADSAPIAGQSKTGRKQVKAGGKGTQGGGGKLAYRPGWHLGEIPYALQFNRIDENGNKELFPYNFVWAEVEYANDVDYQDEAMSYGINANGNFQHSLAGLPRIPENGSYRYRTNPNPNTDPWIISGAIKINRLLTPTEVDKIVKSAGREPQRRQKGFITDKYIDFLNAKFSNDTDIRFRIGPDSETSMTESQRAAFDAVSSMLENAGIEIELMTNEQMQQLAGRADAVLEARIQSDQHQTPQLMTVYHGSGAKFDAFDHNFMGTGEGAQAYGWGSYVTEVKGIGKTYAEKVTGQDYTNKINRLAQHIEVRKEFIKTRKSDIRKNEDYDKYAKNIRKNLGNSQKEYKAAERAGNEKDMDFYQTLIDISNQQLNPDHHKHLIDSFWDDINNAQEDIDKANAEIVDLKKKLKSLKGKRNIYTIEIPDNTGENYLEWEGRADKIIDKVGITVEEYETNDMSTGRDVYEFLNHKLGSDKAASEFLSEVGFVGISYPAQYTTGGRSDGARNYVIFNEKDLQIKDRIQFMRGKRKVPDTRLPEDESSFKGTVVSSTDGAKIIKNLDILAKEKENNVDNRPRSFLGDVAKALGARQHGSKSQYATFETVNGQVVTIRLSDHNASTLNFDNAGRENGISIVISRKPNQGITNDGNARMVEFFYPDKALQKADGKPLVEIIKSIKQALYSGEYTDTTGLAERQEVNAATQEVRGDIVYGATVGGKIYLNGEHLNPESPIHEYTHLWDAACQKNNPELWKRGVELMKQTPLWDEVNKDPNYDNLTTDDEIASEVHSRLTGKDGAALLERMAAEMADGKRTVKEAVDALSVVGRLKKWLSDFWYWLKDTMTPWTRGEAEKASLEDFVNMPLKDLARGTDLRTDGGTEILFRIAEEEAEKTTNELREAADNATYDNAVGDSILPEPPQPKNGMTASEFLKTWQQWKKEAIKADKALVEGYVKEISSNMRWWRRFNKDVADFARPLENLHLWIKNNGGKINIDNDAYTDLFSSAGRATYKATRFEEGLFNPLKKTITDMCRNISLKQWAKNLKIEVNVLGMPKQVQAKPYDMVTLYLRAKDMLEAEALGMVDRGAQGFMETTGMAASDFVADFEKIFTEKEIDNLWKRINGCTDFTLRTYLDEGMMTQDEYDKYSNRRFYVPQRGWAQNEFAEYVPEYAGMDKYGDNHVFNAALTKAKGRVSLASEPLKYIYSMATSAIVATEKNAVKRKFLKMVRDNSDLGGKSQAFTMRKVWYVRTDSKDETTGKPLFKRVYVRPAQELFDKDRDIYKQISELEIKAMLAKTGTERKGIYERIKELRDEINIHYKNNPQLVSNRPADELEEHVVRVVEDGTEYEIQTKDHQVANVLNRRSKSDKFNSWKKHAGKLTRFFTGMYTRYKPTFAFSNLFRDIRGAFQANSVDFGWKYARKALMNTFTVMPAVAHYAWTGRFTDKKGKELKGSKGKDLRLLQDFFESGAATGFTYLRDIGELEKDLRKEIERGKAAEWTIGKWDAVKKVLSFLTEVSETSVRFAEFKQSIEAGYSKAEAASHAKEVTTNFDRRGAQESVLLQLIVPIYGFFNASVQGVNRYHRLGRGQVLSKGAIRGAMAIARLGFSFYLYGILATMMFPDDPDDERYFSEYERMSNLCLWKLKIPLPHVLRGFYGAGVMTAYWLQDLKSGREAMLQGLQFLLSDLVPAQLDFLIPLEYDEAGRLTYDPNMLGQQLTPTALQAFGDIAFNRDFTGGTVYNKPFMASQDGKTPQTQLGKKDVNSAYQAFTDWLANVSGGSATARTNRDIPYLLDVNPSKIEHVTENFFMPGIIGELAGWTGLIYDAATGNDMDVSKLPLVGKFYRSYNMERYQERLYWKLKKKADRFKYDADEYFKAKNAGDGNAARLYEDMATEEKANAYNSARRLLDDLNPDNEGYMPSAEGIRKLQEQTKEWNKIIE